MPNNPQWNLRSLTLLFAILTCLLPPQGFGADSERQAVTRDNVRDALADALRPDALPVPQLSVLSAFYAKRGYRPMWYNGAAGGKIQELLIVLDNADREGLDPRDYQPQRLRQQCLEGGAEQLAGCEILLSQALLRYAKDVGYGRFQPREFDPDWHIDGDALDSQALLRRMAAARQGSVVLQSLPPAHEGYRALRKALADYRWLASLGGWRGLPEGPNLEPGDKGDRVLLLRERLALTDGAASDVAEPGLYDANLQDAVRQFQARHGLGIDGVVGPRTLEALNVSLPERIAQIRANMERWRWMPRSLPERYLVVNVPAFQLELVADGDVELRTRAIAGRADRTTPAFRSRVVGVVVNPDWTIPRKIAVNEILRHQQQDPDYLRRERIAVWRKTDSGDVEVDPQQLNWQDFDKNNFPFVLRQAPGQHNSLGRVKFAMPNPFDIFIHDTPGTRLFSRNVRTLSSGCVRIENPVELAGKVLDVTNPEIAAEKVAEQISLGETTELPVLPELPVFLVYFTAIVDVGGNYQFRDDVYNRNFKLQDRFTFQ